MSGYPRLDDFRRVLDELDGAPGSLKTLEHAFDALLHSDDCARYFNERFKANHTQPGFMVSISGQYLAIHESRHCTLSFGVESGAKPFANEITSIPNELLFGLVSEASVMVERYRKPEGCGDVFDLGSRVVHAGSQTLRRGDVMHLDARFDYVNMAYDHRFVSLTATMRKPASYLSERYNSHDGSAKYVTASSSDSTRVEYACEVLKHLGNAESIQPLQALCRHPAHFLRWKAVEALINVDYESGRSVLETFLGDEHPHVRSSARLALDSLPR